MIHKKPTMTAAELEKYRLSLSLSQAELASLIGVTPQAVRLWERSERSIPETTVRLIALFKKYPQIISEF